MPNKGNLLKKVETAKNNFNSKTRERKQYRSIQLQSNKPTQYWRKTARGNSHTQD